MKVLSIGNSFSQDAHRYLSKIAKANGDKLQTVNLYIGGCSLRTHYINMLGDKDLYLLEHNGESTNVKVSLRQALESGVWDVVTLQQVSTQSVDKKTFTPYIEELASYVRKLCPHAKIFIHETWAYEDGSERLFTAGEYKKSADMFKDIKNSYLNAKKLIKADGIIPAGAVMQKAISLGIGKIHRDTVHASFGAGRYLLGLTWYKTLTGKDISSDAFNEFDEPIEQEQIEIIKKSVNSVVKG